MSLDNYGIGSSYISNVSASATSASVIPVFNLLRRSTTEGQLAVGCQCMAKAIETVKAHLMFLQAEDLRDLGQKLTTYVKRVLWRHLFAYSPQVTIGRGGVNTEMPMWEVAMESHQKCDRISAGSRKNDG